MGKDEVKRKEALGRKEMNGGTLETCSFNIQTLCSSTNSTGGSIFAFDSSYGEEEHVYMYYAL